MSETESRIPVHILYIEDDEGLARLLQKRMARGGFTIDIAASGEDGLAQYQPGKYDAILLDYTLPGIDGIEVLKRLAPKDGEPPVIMLTAGGNEHLAVQALQLGAEDYMVKDVGQTYLDLLPHVINAALVKLNLRKQNRAQQDDLRYYISELEARNNSLMTEVQERKELEMRLREAKDKAEAANIAKTEFLANMSHEIRTPMNAVIGLANILALSEPLTDKQREFIRTLQLSADSLLALINDLLDISRIEARTVELEHIPFNMTQVMEEIISLMSVRTKEKGIDFTLKDETSPGRVYIGDPSRLRQVILNLCSNAVKFTDKGGVNIHIRGTLDPETEIKTVKISVADTGIGIPSDKLDTIFEKFVQADSSINRKYGGTGLGLAISKTLVEIMGGTVDVQSEVDIGSVFTVTLPLQTKVLEKPVADTPKLDAALRNRNPKGAQILIVEDYGPNVLVVSNFLQEFGYGYDVASSGLEALSKIREKKFSAVLMDVQMHAMNGLETTRLVRAYEEQMGQRRLPIIGVTAHVLAGDRERCLGAGMADYLPKPFNPDDLLTLLQRYCGGRS